MAKLSEAAKVRENVTDGGGPWTTNDEIRYVNKLNLEQLTSYESSLRFRHKWGGLDGLLIIRHTAERLKQLQEAEASERDA